MIHTFYKGIYPKVNVIARLEFKLAYYDPAVQLFNPLHLEDTPTILVTGNYSLYK